MDPITVVSGFGRCGTSLVMQMLEAGRMRVTGEWPAFEHDIAMGGTLDGWRAMEGCAVKLLDPVRRPLPAGLSFRAIWITRDFTEQARSIIKFSRLHDIPCERDELTLAANLRRETPDAIAKLALSATRFLAISFEDIIHGPKSIAQTLAFFCGLRHTKEMTAAVRMRSTRCYPSLLEMDLLRERAR